MFNLKFFILALLGTIIVAKISISLFFTNFLFLILLLFGLISSYKHKNYINTIMYLSCIFVSTYSKLDIFNKNHKMLQLVFLISYIFLCISSCIFVFNLIKKIKSIFINKNKKYYS